MKVYKKDNKQEKHNFGTQHVAVVVLADNNNASFPHTQKDFKDLIEFMGKNYLQLCIYCVAAYFSIYPDFQNISISFDICFLMLSNILCYTEMYQNTMNA